MTSVLEKNIHDYGFDVNLNRGDDRLHTLVYDIFKERVNPALLSGSLIEASGAGQMTFKSVSAGGSTLQYGISDQGAFTFGDGNGGDVTLTSNTTLTADQYYDNLTIPSSIVLNPAGYRIFVRNTLICNGIIRRNGNAGGNATAQPAGSAGAALAAGYLNGSPAGKAGGAGGVGGNGDAGIAGATTSNSVGSNGAAGGAGANGGGAFTGGAGGAGGVATASNVALRAGWHLTTLLDIGSTGTPVKFDNSGGSGSGGGGGAGSIDGSGGGGSGSGGGIIAIYAKKLILAVGGLIEANGGAGGNGGPAGGTPQCAGGGGGGAGGNGGQIILVYNELIEEGTVQVLGGAGGSGGASSGACAAATNGGNGSNGTIRRFKISL